MDSVQVMLSKILLGFHLFQVVWKTKSRRSQILGDFNIFENVLQIMTDVLGGLLKGCFIWSCYLGLYFPGAKLFAWKKKKYWISGTTDFRQAFTKCSPKCNGLSNKTIFEWSLAATLTCAIVVVMFNNFAFIWPILIKFGLPWWCILAANKTIISANFEYESQGHNLQKA